MGCGGFYREEKDDHRYAAEVSDTTMLLWKTNAGNFIFLS